MSLVIAFILVGVLLAISALFSLISIVGIELYWLFDFWYWLEEVGRKWKSRFNRLIGKKEKPAGESERKEEPK